MNHFQIRWYAEMISKDKKEQFELARNLVEYQVSFEYGEAIRKIKQSREAAENHTFMDDDKFEEFVKNDDFKNNAIVNAIKASKSAANLNNNIAASSRVRRPIDLDSIAGIVRKNSD